MQLAGSPTLMKFTYPTELRTPGYFFLNRHQVSVKPHLEMTYPLPKATPHRRKIFLGKTLFQVAGVGPVRASAAKFGVRSEKLPCADGPL